MIDLYFICDTGAQKFLRRNDQNRPDFRKFYQLDGNCGFPQRLCFTDVDRAFDLIARIAAGKERIASDKYGDLPTKSSPELRVKKVKARVYPQSTSNHALGCLAAKPVTDLRFVHTYHGNLRYYVVKDTRSGAYLRRASDLTTWYTLTDDYKAALYFGGHQPALDAIKKLADTSSDSRLDHLRPQPPALVVEKRLGLLRGRQTSRLAQLLTRDQKVYTTPFHAIVQEL